jgi:hypothetical protein
METIREIRSNLDVDENIVYTTMQKEMNLSNLHHKEEKEMRKLSSSLFWLALLQLKGGFPKDRIAKAMEWRL